MKKQKISSLLSAGVISSTVLVAPLAKPAFALDASDGVKANHTYTFSNVLYDGPVFTEEGESPVKVYVKDKNGTVEGEINPGESITSKTGTITWKDSYENVTAFYLDIKKGYEAEVYVDGKKGTTHENNGSLTVQVNSDLGKDRTYTLDPKDEYEKVFYFSSAGKEAWSKNHTFEIKVSKKESNLTIEKYKENINGQMKLIRTEEKIQHGTQLNRENLGLGPNEYILGANTVEFDGTPIKVVERPNSFGNYQYGFTYVGDTNLSNADEHIKSVHAYWNDNKDNLVPVNLNETVKLKTNGLLWDEHKINFVVEVESGYELTGKLSSGKDLEVSHPYSNESSEIYEIGFTRVGHHGYHNNPVHETFTLQTNPIKQPLK